MDKLIAQLELIKKQTGDATDGTTDQLPDSKVENSVNVVQTAGDLEFDFGKPIKINIERPINTLRIVNWPEKKGEERFSFERGKDDRVFLFYGKTSRRFGSIS